MHASKKIGRYFCIRKLVIVEIHTKLKLRSFYECRLIVIKINQIKNFKNKNEHSVLSKININSRNFECFFKIFFNFQFSEKKILPSLGVLCY